MVRRLIDSLRVGKCVPATEVSIDDGEYQQERENAVRNLHRGIADSATNNPLIFIRKGNQK